MQQKFDHLSSKLRSLRSVLAGYESENFDKFKEGDLIHFVRTNTIGVPSSRHFLSFMGIVIFKNNTKKKWLMQYKILTDHCIWEVNHLQIEKSFRIKRENE